MSKKILIGCLWVALFAPCLNSSAETNLVLMKVFTADPAAMVCHNTIN